MGQFVDFKGMLGFALTQGRVPSAVPYMRHALKDMKNGRLGHISDKRQSVPGPNESAL